MRHAALPHVIRAQATSSLAPTAPTVVAGKALRALRREHAVVVARVRVALRCALAAVLALSTRTSWYSPPAGPELVAALASAVVLWLLVKRRHVSTAVVAGAVIDCLALASGGWNDLHGATPFTASVDAVLLLTATYFAVLAAVLSLPTFVRESFVVALCALTASWASACEYPWPFALAVTMVISSFAVAAVWLGRQLMRLVADRVVEECSSALAHAERDRLDSANMQLARLNAELLVSQQQSETLTQLIVHDLRNPLSVVLAQLDVALPRLAAIPGVTDEVLDLAVAQPEALRLNGMINDLLVVAKLEKGYLRAEPKPTDVYDLLHAAAVAVKADASSHAVRVEVDADADLTAAVDVLLMRRLLDNLMRNAVRCTRAGDRILLAAQADGPNLRIVVRNSGPPVSEVARARLFEKFASVGGDRSKGFGLGLYLCRLVAEAHHGTIALVDRPEWSVSFETVLPAAPSPRESGDGDRRDGTS